jgi:hypothetical protein
MTPTYSSEVSTFSLELIQYMPNGRVGASSMGHRGNNHATTAPTPEQSWSTISSSAPFDSHQWVSRPLKMECSHCFCDSLYKCGSPLPCSCSLYTKLAPTLKGTCTTLRSTINHILSSYVTTPFAKPFHSVIHLSQPHHISLSQHNTYIFTILSCPVHLLFHLS